MVLKQFEVGKRYTQQFLQVAIALSDILGYIKVQTSHLSDVFFCEKYNIQTCIPRSQENRFYRVKNKKSTTSNPGPSFIIPSPGA